MSNLVTVLFSYKYFDNQFGKKKAWDPRLEGSIRFKFLYISMPFNIILFRQSIRLCICHYSRGGGLLRRLNTIILQGILI